MYFLQVWFSLSDRDTEDALNDIISMRDFSRIDFSGMEPPDATTLLHFRHTLEKNDLCRQIFERVKALLLEKGLMWKGGTILDATLIPAPKATRNEGNVRDMEMGSTCKYGSHCFGAKAHIGVDSGTGYVHSVEVTAANEHDITLACKLVRDDGEVRKLPFKGIAKNRNRLLVLFTSINVYMLAIAGRSFRNPFPQKLAAQAG
jgi:IS5 family transposase